MAEQDAKQSEIAPYRAEWRAYGRRRGISHVLFAGAFLALIGAVPLRTAEAVLAPIALILAGGLTGVGVWLRTLRCPRCRARWQETEEGGLPVTCAKCGLLLWWEDND